MKKTVEPLSAKMPAFEEALSAAMGQPGPRKNAEALQEILDLLQTIKAQEEDAPEAPPAPPVLTPEMVRDYVENSCIACPFCGWEQPKILKSDSMGSEHIERMQCPDCKNEWTDVSLLAGIRLEYWNGATVWAVDPGLAASAPAMRSALEKIGHVLDPGESDPVGMAEILRKIGNIQAAAIKATRP